MKTVREVLQLSSSYFEERGIDRPRRLAEELLAHILRLKRIDLYLQSDLPLEEEELALLRCLLRRKAQGEPLEYITGEISFYGCRIKVDQRALIPRPETEILVDLLSQRLQGSKLWDLCTGSGCIGIALKKKFPHLEVFLSDLSEEALSLAQENAELNQVGVEICRGDLFVPFAGRTTDCIISNPPYIGAEEFSALDSSVRNYEPTIALLAGRRGTEFYERLSKEAPAFLNPGGQICLEIGWNQGCEVSSFFSKAPWKQTELLPDWAGKDRFFFANL